MAREVRMDVSEEESLRLNNKFVDLTFETKDDGIQVPINLTVSNIYLQV